MIFTRTAIQERLGQVFEPRQATVLAEVIVAAYTDLVKTSDFNELKAITRDLAAAQTRTEARVEELAAAQARTEARLEALIGRVDALAAAQARTEARVEELAAAQARTEARLEALIGRVDALAAAQARTEARVEELAVAQARTEEELRALTKVVNTMLETQRAILDEQAAMKGTLLEMRYRDRIGSYLGTVLRRAKAFMPAELEEEVAPHLSPSEYQDWLQVDLVVQGRPKEHPEREIWLAMEVSTVVDRRDVQRAAQRAGYLRQAGYPVVAAAAGEKATKGAKSLAGEEGVALFLDGQATFWDKALAQALAGPGA